jgi:phytoene synthase
MSVQEAYAEVGRITRREAKNFAYGIMVLPKAKRQAIAAIYAFARRVDDVADGELPPEEKRERLEELRAALEADRADPVFVALRDARERFGIPTGPLEALVDGGLQDIEQSTYADFADLRGYCEKVAGAVGLACVPIYGSDDTDHAMTLGIALQLINIIRDVDEDRLLGRVYLPQDELAAFGVEELAPSPQFRQLMAFEAERARTYLAEGLRLLESLDRRSALCVGTFAGLYSETLDRIEQSGFDVFGEKTRLSTPRKLAVVAQGFLPGRWRSSGEASRASPRRSTSSTPVMG